MKIVFYFLTILFLSLMLACSEEPPTTVESDLNKKPVKPPPPPLEPVEIFAGDVHIIAGCLESGRRNSKVSFRLWTNFNETPQIR